MRAVALLAVIAMGPVAFGQETPGSTVTTTPSSGPSTSSPAPLAATPQRLTMPASMTTRWHKARVLYGVGSVMSLVGSALTLSSVLVVAITGYPCNPNDPVHQLNPNDTCNQMGTNYNPPSPTDAAPLLAYIGSSVSALGFVLSASGLGYEHHLLWEVNADTGRGLFGVGTAFGVLGFASVGASYFFGFTNYLNPHDQGLAILSTTIIGTGLCLIGGILYTADSSRMKRAWDLISTF